MSNTITISADKLRKIEKAKQREAFMQAGGYDGRFRSKSIPSGKQYTRKQKHKDKGWE
jgi:hypothetical protein